MRQVICKAPPDLNGMIVLVGDVYRHLALSLRKKVGERINLRLRTGELVEAEIIRVSKKEILCKVLDTIKEEAPLNVVFVLLQWELKGDKMETVVRQSTEIGVRYIIPVIGRYSVPISKNEKEKNRRESVICSAREQSGSPVDTVIFESTSLNFALQYLNNLVKGKEVKKFLAYEKKGDICKTVFSALEGKEDVIVVAIGAEGGISEEECSLLTKNGFDKLHFATNILKAETAAVYALSSLREAYVERNRSLMLS